MVNYLDRDIFKSKCLGINNLFQTVIKYLSVTPYNFIRQHILCYIHKILQELI